MSKKLIAVASAAALALTALVGVAPASATTTISGGDKSGLTAALATSINVPFDNEVESADGEIVTFTVSSAANRSVSADATGGIKLLTELTDADQKAVKSTDGLTKLAIGTGVSTSVTFYAFTTSTATGTVVVNDGVGNTQTFYIKGIAGPAYNVSVVAPTSIPTTGTGAAMQIKVTDVFGNALASLGGAGLDVKTLGAGSSVHITATAGTAITAPFTTTANYNDTKKVFEVNLRSTTGGGAAVTVVLSKAVGAPTVGPDEVSGLAKPVSTFFVSINTADLAAQVAALQAQVASMVTKKRYNTLARKWNRAFPGDKVKLKK